MVLELPSTCATCGAEHPAATQLGHDRPWRPGGVAFCAFCHSPSVIGDDLRLRRPTPAEADAMAVDPGLIRIRAALQTARDLRQRSN